MVTTQPASSTGTRRAELGGFLKAARARLRPEDAGLPPGPRRRTPGLRREEVALLAGVGVSWYTWLEQGRPIKASGQVLDAVARTLQLDAAGRWHLYRLAEALPLRSWARTAVVPDALSDVLRSLDPLPAVLINDRFDIIDSNDAHEELFWDWHALPCVHKNLLWCTVTEPRARELLLNYDDEVPYLVGRLRAAYAQHIGDPEWDEDIRRLSGLSPEFVALWARHEVAAAGCPHAAAAAPGRRAADLHPHRPRRLRRARTADRRVQPARRWHQGTAAAHPPRSGLTKPLRSRRVLRPGRGSRRAG